MEQVVDLFNNFAFPMGLSILLLWFIYTKIWKRIEMTLDTITETNRELAESNKTLSKNINNKMVELNNKVDLILRNEG